MLSIYMHSHLNFNYFICLWESEAQFIVNMLHRIYPTFESVYILYMRSTYSLLFPWSLLTDLEPALRR